MKAKRKADGKNTTIKVSRRDALKLGGTLLIGATLPGCVSYLAKTRATVGDPSDPATLSTAIIDAYHNGVRNITVTPGTYVLPATGKNSIELTGWENARIHFEGTTIIFEEMDQRPFKLSGCTNVTIEDATFQLARISYTQGKIIATGDDGEGKYVDWQIDVGYPAPTDILTNYNAFNVIDPNTRLFKVGTGDCHANKATLIGPRLYRLRQFTGDANGPAIGDWLVCRTNGKSFTDLTWWSALNPAGSIIQLDNCKSCTLRRVTLKNAGFGAFFETGGDGGHHYLDCRVTRGPKPAEATEEQLVSCSADGFHSVGTRVGPTLERCVWDGVLLDDCIAVHGSLQTVIRAEGNKLILENGTAFHTVMDKFVIKRGNLDAGFAVNEPVRISSTDGFFGQATCVALRELETPDKHLELTLDRILPVPAGAKAGNPERCGKSYKIIGCTLGNTRSRGILVKADDGLIQHCVIEGCGMSAISIGPEYWWNEANYAWNVTVADNHFRHNSLRNNLHADAVIFVHGDGVIGNRNINIANNRFEENYCPYMMNIGWADGVKIINNIFNAPSPLPLSHRGYIIYLHDVRNAMIKGNTYSKPGASVVQAIHVGENVKGVAGNDDSGIRLLE